MSFAPDRPPHDTAMPEDELLAIARAGPATARGRS